MTTPILGLPEIAESQAKKYLTHNTANRMIEACRFAVAKSQTTAAQPATADDGDVYILPASPTGDSWQHFAKDDIAIAIGGGWQRVTPSARTVFHFAVEDTNTWTRWDHGALEWVSSAAPGEGTGTGTGTGNGGSTPTGDITAARIVVTQNHGGGYVQFRLLEFRKAKGVAEPTPVGTYFQTSVYDTIYPADNLFDASTATVWASQDGAALPQMAGVVFATPVASLAEFMYETSGNDGVYRPQAGRFEISRDSTDGTDGTWETAATFTGNPQADGVYLYDYTPPVTPPGPTPVTVRYLRLTLNEAPVGGSTGYRSAVLSALRILEGATDRALAATVTPQSTHAVYFATALNDDDSSSNWSNGADLPQTIDIDLGAEYPIDTYELVAPTDSGNAAHFPTAWKLEGGTLQTNMVLLDEQAGIGPVTIGAASSHTISATPPPTTTPAYKFYRYEIDSYFGMTGSTQFGINEFELYDENGTNVATTGTATANGTRSGYSPDHFINGDRNAPSDGSYNILWISPDGVGPHYIQIELPTATALSKYAVVWPGYPADSTGYGTEVGRLVGSNDGASWDVLHSFTNLATDVNPEGVAEHVFTSEAELTTTPVTLSTYHDLAGGASFAADVLTLPVAKSTTGFIGTSAASELFPYGNGIEVEFAIDSDNQDVYGYAGYSYQWLSVGLNKAADPAAIPLGSAQWEYAQPHLVAAPPSEGFVAFRYGPGATQAGNQVEVDVATPDDANHVIPRTEWEQSWGALDVPRLVKVRIRNVNATDTEVAVWADGATTPDVAILAGYRLDGNVSLVFWASDYDRAKNYTISNIKVGAL